MIFNKFIGAKSREYGLFISGAESREYIKFISGARAEGLLLR
jgi:hypothetical protein